MKPYPRKLVSPIPFPLYSWLPPLSFIAPPCYNRWIQPKSARRIFIMKRFALRFFFLSATVCLISAALDLYSSKAAPQTTYGYTCVSYVPAAWGEFKGGNQQSGLAFQDRDGTLRFVTNLPCDATPQPALEIRRTAPNQ